MARKQIVLVALFGATLAGVYLIQGELRGRPASQTPTAPTFSEANAPGTVTLRYWLEAGRVFRRAGGASRLIVEHAAEYRAGKLTTDERCGRFWGEWGRLYGQHSADARGAAERLRTLPTDGVDSAATRLVAEAVDYLECRAALHRSNAGDCVEYAALYDAIVAATSQLGAVAGVAATAAEDNPAVRPLADREEKLRAIMFRRIETEGRAEKDKLATTLATAARVRAELTARYGAEFPDFNSSPPYLNK